MNTLNLLLKNGSTSIAAGINSSFLSYFLLNDGYYEIPYFDYDIRFFVLYGLMASLSSGLVNVTGDFVFPLVSGNNMMLNKIEMLSRPISVGLLSLIVLYFMNGMVIPSIENAGKMFLLTSGSYLAADYLTNILYKNNGVLSMNAPPVNNSNITIRQSMNQNIPNTTNPIDYFGLGGFGAYL